jgi:hypothetical protein
MIHDPMITEIITRTQKAPVDSLTTALGDWIFLSRYNGFRKSEWCNDHHTKYARIKDPLWTGPDAVAFILEDFSFFSPSGVKLTDVPALPLDQVGYSTILNRRQKKQRQLPDSHIWEVYLQPDSLSCRRNALHCPVHPSSPSPGTDPGCYLLGRTLFSPPPDYGS